MNKLVLGAIITGAAIATGYVVSKLLSGPEIEPDFDDDIYDYPDPYETDESIDFEINDDLSEENIPDELKNIDDADLAGAVEETAETDGEDEAKL